jgi:uridine phosphorylase
MSAVGGSRVPQHDQHMDLPLLEHDFDQPGVLEPSQVIEPRDIPRCAVLSYFADVLESVSARPDAQGVATLRVAHGPHPIVEIEHTGCRLAVVQCGVGAPLAAGLMEEAIAMGCRTLVAVGGAGALVPELALGQAVVVESALRDEGTSFHYLPAGRTLDADPAGVASLRQVLDDASVPYIGGRTWTTDAVYRETRTAVNKRIAEGCITVEMEASAFIAVARYRHMRFAQLLYAGDSLAAEEWDERDWTTVTSVREQLFWLAADACLLLDRATAADDPIG